MLLSGLQTILNLVELDGELIGCSLQVSSVDVCLCNEDVLSSTYSGSVVTSCPTEADSLILGSVGTCNEINRSLVAL